MTKLIVPDYDLVLETLKLEGEIAEEQLEAAAKLIVEISSQLAEDEDDPIYQSLTVDQINAVQESNISMAKERVSPEERREKATEMIGHFIEENLLSEADKAAELEKELTAAAINEKLDLDNGEAVSRAISQSKIKIPYIRIWIRSQTSFYSSIRGGSASANTGGPWWRRQHRCLRVVAATQAANIVTRLFWRFNDHTGSVKLWERGTIQTVVISSHFRGVVCIIPTRADWLVAGASRYGSVQQNFQLNRQTIAKHASFVVNDGVLNNVTYFGRSSDVGLSLFVSGNI